MNDFDPYQDIDNTRGYDQAEVKGLVRDYVCAGCGSKLVQFFHPKPFTFTLRCAGRLDGCNSVTIVSLNYLAYLERKAIEDTDRVLSTLKNNELKGFQKMPILQTSKPKATFREVGKIRKGVTVATKNGGTRPKEVEYLVMDFLPEEQEAADVFFSVYGDKPKAIRFHAPFDNIEDFWDGWYTCFKGSRMIAKAGLNPGLAERFAYDPDLTMFYERLYSVDQNTWLVKNWLDGEGKPRVCDLSVNVDPRNGEPIGEVIYSVTKDNGKVEDYYLKPTGTLKVFVKELKPFLGFLALHTGGKVDINNISGELAGIEMLAKQSNIPLTAIPLLLSRRREGVRSPDGQQTYHYNFHVGIDPEFSKKMYLLQASEVDQRFSGLLGAGSAPVSNPREIAALPDVQAEEYFDSLEDDNPEIVEAQFDEAEAEGDAIEIGSFKDFWKFAEGLGIDMQAERVTINDIWKNFDDNPGAAIKAINLLAGRDEG